MLDDAPGKQGGLGHEALLRRAKKSGEADRIGVGAMVGFEMSHLSQIPPRLRFARFPEDALDDGGGNDMGSGCGDAQIGDLCGGAVAGDEPVGGVDELLDGEVAVDGDGFASAGHDGLRRLEEHHCPFHLFYNRGGRSFADMLRLLAV